MADDPMTTNDGSIFPEFNVGVPMPAGTKAPPPAMTAELQRRLWALFDAAKALAETESPERWAALYIAVADIPESQRP